MKDLLRNRPLHQTIFTLNEIAQLTGRVADAALVGQVHYYVKNGELFRLAKGIYALDQEYSPKELGNKLRVPSYVSLSTILQERGIIFQPYTSIFLVANRSEHVTIGSHHLVYRKIKTEVLLNTLGITNADGVQCATAERAIADTLYLDSHQHFDNLRSINLEFLAQLNTVVYKSKKIDTYITSLRK